jgi:hypothetical protein
MRKEDGKEIIIMKQSPEQNKKDWHLVILREVNL